MNATGEDPLLELQRLVRQWMDKGRKNFGFDDVKAERYYNMAVPADAQAHLLGSIALQIGDPTYFNKPRSIMEAGCGTGSFLLAVLKRGYDGWGIDNDPDRLVIGHAKIPAYGYPYQWKERFVQGDAESTPFESNQFDVVFGHQFIEHVDHIPGVISELLRIARPGGYVVLNAPDYRFPHEAHYEMPWPPFPSRRVEEQWLEAFGRPTGGLGSFNYATLPQVGSVFQSLNCDIVSATLDRPFDPAVIGLFDTSSAGAVESTAKRIRSGWEAGTLPPSLVAPTCFAIAVRKR